MREPHELEVLLDRERVKLFTVAPPKGDRNFEKVDAHLKVRVPVTAGPHQVGVTFLKNPSSLLETKRQPYLARFNMHRHPRLGAGDLSGFDHRPVRVEGAGRHAEPAADFRAPADECRRRRTRAPSESSPR